MNSQVVIIGAGGHAKVILDIILKNNDTVIGFLDDAKEIGEKVLNYTVIGRTTNIQKIHMLNPNYKFIIAIGDNKKRFDLACKFNVPYYTAIHPDASIGIDVKIGDGTCIMAKTAINSAVRIGNHCIINTGSVIEHDNIINDYVHISSNVSLGGNVTIDNLTLIGIGSTVINNVSITSNCIIGAGAVVLKDISKSGVYVGIPAKCIS